MKAFDWAEPQNIEQAMVLLAKGGGRAAMMAGGTDLITEIKEGVAQPDLVIDLRSIPGLSFINKEKDGVHIGAMTTVAELAAHSSLRQEYPGLHQAAMSIGTPQLRNVGTVGGNLCQRPRCWYYRDAQIVCRKKGGSQCFAFRGRNKYHAIFGGGLCYIAYPSDLAPALISMGAQAVIVSPRGERKIPLEDFYALPSRTFAGRTFSLKTSSSGRFTFRRPGSRRKALTSSSKKEGRGISPSSPRRPQVRHPASASARSGSFSAASRRFPGG